MLLNMLDALANDIIIWRVLLPASLCFAPSILPGVDCLALHTTSVFNVPLALLTQWF